MINLVQQLIGARQPRLLRALALAPALERQPAARTRSGGSEIADLFSNQQVLLSTAVAQKEVPTNQVQAIEGSREGEALVVSHGDADHHQVIASGQHEATDVGGTVATFAASVCEPATAASINIHALPQAA